jgi:hypothetical protein
MHLLQLDTQSILATGAPDLTAAPAESGVGHQDFTVQQMQAWVDMLAFSARVSVHLVQKKLQALQLAFRTSTLIQDGVHQS